MPHRVRYFLDFKSCFGRSEKNKRGGDRAGKLFSHSTSPMFSFLVFRTAPQLTISGSRDFTSFLNNYIVNYFYLNCIASENPLWGSGNVCNVYACMYGEDH